ncbi:hypothetical protein Dimus_011185, partial [Dionaea muscipula]
LLMMLKVEAYWKSWKLMVWILPSLLLGLMMEHWDGFLELFVTSSCVFLHRLQ